MQAAVPSRVADGRPFASPKDLAYCRRLHRLHGTTYYFASRRFPVEMRNRVDALYGFVREADEWVDNPGPMSKRESALRLKCFREGLHLAVQRGIRPSEPTLRAFADTVIETDLPLSEPDLFLDAMEMDLHLTRYETWDDLLGYMRGSAAAVGVMMSWMIGAPRDPQTLGAAQALGNAMQLTNFIRDVGEDLERGRIYMPLTEMAEHGLDAEFLERRQVTDEWRAFLKFQIARARDLYAEADAGIEQIPAENRLAVRLARELYARILDRVEERDYDVFSGRARTSRWEKMQTAARMILGR
ncbi:MAG: phytoene/squalene synthase family protein [Fimbriimonadaceae bacterium]|nr:phytoene/squalene synthase family protein [Fimbriimonadaceae bacterium]